MSYEQWLVAVCDLLKSQHNAMYTAALATGPYKTLEEMRGDEPNDCYELDDSVEQYVQHLVDEWTLYGPEGE